MNDRDKAREQIMGVTRGLTMINPQPRDNGYLAAFPFDTARDSFYNSEC